MASNNKRYRFALIEQPGESDPRRLPTRYRRYQGYRPPPPLVLRPNDPMAALLEAFAYLDRRGEGFEGWAPSLADNPIAFLLDALGDAVFLRDAKDGRLIYRNRAARQLPLGRREKPTAAPEKSEEPADTHTSRRSMVFRWGRLTLEVEVLQVLG